MGRKTAVDEIPEPTHERPLLSVHVPKTAGTSFREMLKRHFGSGISFSYRNELLDPEFEFTLRKSKLSPEESERIRRHCASKDVRCIHGHFSLGRFLGTFEDSSAIAFVRDPIDRLVSEYWFQVRSENIDYTPAGYKAHTGEYSFEDYMYEVTRSSIYDLYGLAEYFDRFSFIGITESFDDSLRILHRKAPWLDLQADKKLNVAEDSKPPLDPNLRQQLERRVQTDIDIYNEARERFRRELEKL